MNILLANLYWEHGLDGSLKNMRHLHYPTGLAIIAGEIKRKRKDTLFAIDSYTQCIKDEAIFDYVDKNKIDCILVSMYLGNYQYRYLKKFINNIVHIFPQVTVVVGGPMSSTIPKLLLENTIAVDKRVVCVIGEGEDTIIELLSCLDGKCDLSKVKGICYREKEVVFTTPRPRIQNLDDYPRLDYDIFDTPRYVKYVKETNRCWEIVASRGCYGNCIFCKRVFGNKITLRSAASIVNEMEDFYSDYGVSRFNFVDDNFLNSEKQVWDFYSTLKESDIKFQWRFQGRADLFSKPLAEALLEVGCYDVSFGIESGAIEILSAMNKKIDINKTCANIRSLPSQLETHASFIVGMPAESPKTINDTVMFIKNTGLDYASAGILTLFPGTGIYEFAKNNGLITDEDAYCENLGPVYVKPYINLTKYPDEQLLEWAVMINKSSLMN